MKISVKLFSSTFFIILAKVMYDIYFVSNFLLKNQILYTYRAIIVSALIGFILTYIYNVIQKKYPFVISVLYLSVLFLSIPVSLIYIDRPFSNHYILYSIPAYVLFGNTLIFLYFKGVASRVTIIKLFNIEQIIAVAKGLALTIVGGALIYIQSSGSITFFTENVQYAYIFFVIGFLIMLYTIISTPNANEAVENSLIVKVENSFFRLIQSSYYGILLLFGIGIGIILSYISDLYYTNTMITTFHIEDSFKVFGYYVVIFAVLGFVYEIFFRKKLMQYFGLKNNIKILPSTISIFAVLLIIEHFVFLNNPNSEFKFLYFFVLQMLMVSLHFIFENISFPSIFSFLQPVNVNKRHDFFTKSFLVGLTVGVVIAFMSLYYMRPHYFGSSNHFYPFLLAIAAVILIAANIPLFRKYKHELQTLLYSRSKYNAGKITNDISAIKDEDIKQFAGIQFVRYINLLELINPKMSREVVLKTFKSENNFFQRVVLIKASIGQYLEGLTALKEIQETRYFKSSPNKDKILALISRIEEINFRMKQPKYIDQLSISKKENERVFGAKLTYFTDPKEKEFIISRLLRDSQLPVVKSALIAAIEADIETIIPQITNKLNFPALSNAAYSTLLSYDNTFLSSIDKMFYQTGQSERVQLKIIQLYGKIANKEATEFLVKKINHSNQNIVSAVLKSLSRCNIALAEDKTILLKHELDELLKILVWNISFKISLSDSELSDELKDAIENEIRDNYDNVFNLLSLLYDYSSIMLLRDNLFSYDQDKVAFSIELASILFSEDSLKPKIMPLIQPISDVEFVKAMQMYAPTEELSPREILYTLIQRDCKWINQWTKACALNELIKQKFTNCTPVYLSNMINPDTMLAELAAHAMFKTDKSVYLENKNIFKDAYVGLLDQTVLDKIEERSREKVDFPILKYDIINYLKSIDEFSGISGETLKHLSSFILPISLQANEQFEITDNFEIKSFHYILYSGSVSLYINKQKIKTYLKGAFISSLDLLFEYDAEVCLISNEKSVVYQLSPDYFSEQLSQNQDIVVSIIFNTKVNRYAELEDLVKRRPITLINNDKNNLQLVEDVMLN